MTEELYGEHVRTRLAKAQDVLAQAGFDALLLHAGTPMRYFADDVDAPFRSNPHFASWVPLQGPGHLLFVRPGERPRLVRVAPEDYWYEQAPLGDPFWAAELDVTEVGSEDAAWKALGSLRGVAYIGDAPDDARAHGIAAGAANPPAVVLRLDWDRSTKTPYEVACLDEAARLAGIGHRAARAAFEAGESELGIHQAYVTAVGCTDADLPYESIVGLDEKGATLHYTGKRKAKGGRVLLIDSGAKHLGYCSDVTRTWTRAGAPARFRELVLGMDGVQRDLCAAVRPGTPYPDLHRTAHERIGDLLRTIGVIDLAGEEAFARGLTQPFFPHGLGHFLGIQVHDVAGHQKERAGGRVPPPEHSPFLRTTRTIEEGQVFTIEPGVYFIEMLLRPHRSGATARHFDWKRIEELAPCGGVRIEDDVLVTGSGHRNLTRPFV